jgi:hypothetical protein
LRKSVRGEVYRTAPSGLDIPQYLLFPDERAFPILTSPSLSAGQTKSYKQKVGAGGWAGWGGGGGAFIFSLPCQELSSLHRTEAEFSDVIGTKVFLLAIHSHLYSQVLPPPPHPPSRSGLKLVCNVNIVYGNLKSESSQDNAQKPQRNCTFMNSASGLHPAVISYFYLKY